MPELIEDGLAVDVLIPKISNQETFRIRYSGLVEKLGEKGILAYFAFGHETYDRQQHRFVDQVTVSGEAIKAPHQPTVVRNLTMAYYDRPIYDDPEAPRLVHETDFNRFLSRKDRVAELLPEIHPLTVVADSAELEEAAAAIPGHRVIIKPVTGLRSEKVRVVRKKDLKSPKDLSQYLVQEYIDTGRGDSRLGIDGTHNIRLLSVNSTLAGAIAKVGGERKSMLLNGDYGEAFAPEDLPDEIHSLVDEVHQKLKELPGAGKNVIAIDAMYGHSKVREDGYIVCEINERPYRISPYDVGDPTTLDPDGLLWLGREWDKAEAGLLAELAAEERAKRL